MQIIVNIIYSCSIYTIVALSLSVIYNAAKFLNIANGIIITLSAYISYYMIIQLGFSEVISFTVIIIISIFIGLGTEFFLFQKLRNRAKNPLISLIASIGLYIIIQNIISIIWGDETHSLHKGTIKIDNYMFGAYISSIQLKTILICLLLFIFNIIFNNKVKIGIQILAVSSNEVLANIFGINSNKIMLIVFAISSVLCTITGILFAYDVDITPIMGFNLLIYGMVAMIIGGIGSTWGLFCGSLLLATAQHFGAFYIDSKWMDAIAYIVLIIFLILKPLGFSGKRLKKVEI